MKNEYFDFKITAFKPSVVDDDDVKYIAFVLGTDGNPVITKANYDGTDPATGYFEVNPDEEFTVRLKHGENLIFLDIHVGAIIEVKEVGNSKFIPKYVHNFNGTKSAKGTQGEALGFPNEEHNDKGPHYLPENYETNAKFTNTLANTTPTGLDVSDLPYIVLIAVAAAGLVAFVAIKSRKRVNE